MIFYFRVLAERVENTDFYGAAVPMLRPTISPDYYPGVLYPVVFKIAGPNCAQVSLHITDVYSVV